MKKSGTTLSKTHKRAAYLIRQVAIFCFTNAPELYADWTGEKLFKYLAFQLLTGGLILSRSPDIDGVLIAWPDSAAEVWRRERAGEYHFNWRRPMPAAEADAFVLAEVITGKAESRNRKAEIVFRLAQEATARWPDWKLRPLFTWRRGKLVELSPRTSERFLAHVSPIHSGSK